MKDPFDLNRFVAAQSDLFHTALGEIRHGRKQTHWMWFIFPQIAGLGQSPIAQRYAISGRNEACAYLDHAMLGLRYRRCVTALQDLPPSDAVAIFGEIDAIKLRSSLTLFAEVSDEPMFRAALQRWFDGQHDPATLRLLDESRQKPGD
jgi:uncharacterized protein (DUF1810 family)